MSDKQILVPIVTPFNDELDVCEESVKNLIAQCKEYAYGVVPCLTSGEGWCLDIHQWTDMVDYCIKYAGNNLQVIVGIERATTQDVLQYVEIAQNLDVDGIIITTPFGEGVTQQQMIAHYQKIHDHCECNIWIYHEKSLSQNQLLLESLLTIANLPRVVGIKDSGEGTSLIDYTEQFTDAAVKIYHGWEDRLVFGENINGNIVSLSNLEPTICYKATQCVADTKLQNKIDSYCEQYSLTSEDWYRHVKNELFKRGIISTERIIAN